MTSQQEISLSNFRSEQASPLLSRSRNHYRSIPKPIRNDAIVSNTSFNSFHYPLRDLVQVGRDKIFWDVIRCRDHCLPYVKYRDGQNKEPRPGNNGDSVWPDIVEETFWEAIVLYPPMGRDKKRSHGEDQKLRGRNELIAQYLEERVTEHFRRIRAKRPRQLPRKIISSHIQVLKAKFTIRYEDENEELHVYVPREYLLAWQWLGGEDKKGKKNGRSCIQRAQPLSCSPAYCLELESASMSLSLQEGQQPIVHTFAETPMRLEHADVSDLTQDSHWHRDLPELADLFLQGRLKNCDVVLVDSLLALPTESPALQRHEMKLDIKNLFGVPKTSPAIGQTVRTNLEIFENGVLSEKYSQVRCDVNPDGQYLLPLGSNWWVKKLPSLWEYSEDQIRAVKQDRESPSYEADLAELLRARRKNAQQTLRTFTFLQEVFNKREQKIFEREPEQVEQPFLIVCWKFDLAPPNQEGSIVWRRLKLPLSNDVSMEWISQSPAYSYAEQDRSQSVFTYGSDKKSEECDEEDQLSDLHVSDFGQAVNDWRSENCDVAVDAFSEPVIWDQAAGGTKETNVLTIDHPQWHVPLDPAIASIGQSTQGCNTISPERVNDETQELLSRRTHTNPEYNTNGFTHLERDITEGNVDGFSENIEQQIVPLYATTSSIRTTQQHPDGQPSQKHLPFRCVNKSDRQTGSVNSASASQQFYPNETFDEFDRRRLRPCPSSDQHEPCLTASNWPEQQGQQFSLTSDRSDSLQVQAVQRASSTYQEYISQCDGSTKDLLHEEESSQLLSQVVEHRYPTRQRQQQLHQYTLRSQPDSVVERQYCQPPHAESATQPNMTPNGDTTVTPVQAFYDNHDPQVTTEYHNPSETNPTQASHLTEPFKAAETLAARRGSFAPTISTMQDSCFDDITPAPTTAATESFDIGLDSGPKPSQAISCSPEKPTVLKSQPVPGHDGSLEPLPYSTQPGNDPSNPDQSQEPLFTLVTETETHADTQAYPSNYNCTSPVHQPTSYTTVSDLHTAHSFQEPTTYPFDYNVDPNALGLVFDPTVLGGIEEADTRALNCSPADVELETAVSGRVEELSADNGEETVMLGQVEGLPEYAQEQVGEWKGEEGDLPPGGKEQGGSFEHVDEAMADDGARGEVKEEEDEWMMVDEGQC